ncbi:hypothetical protein AVEN_263054-1 [Araneus ventricosus]|uniref:Uncharacterized protein n=1 Tax=Araneus ventricosus TaxID=182803 RepID=A0A4Y2PCJ3_ARAVE|nr:hypothetical protein AVEN_263054-1 [Araneus ventricosus]
MACNIKEKNGHIEPTPPTRGDDVKIVVVGDAKCGKTRFIEAFAKRLRDKSGSYYSTEYARVYQCRYKIKTVPREVKIFEILGGPDNLVNQLVKDQYDANGIVFMYAIDDPSSFQMITEKWFETLKNNGCWKFQPTILVGNKRDLREDQQVIQRLARNNQAPVTEEQGKSLAALNEINEFYECSSIDHNDFFIRRAFSYIVSEGYFDWIISFSE